MEAQLATHGSNAHGQGQVDARVLAPNAWYALAFLDGALAIPS